MALKLTHKILVQLSQDTDAKRKLFFHEDNVANETTEAADHTEALDVGRHAPPDEEEPVAEGEPHRHRPAEAAMVEAAVEPPPAGRARTGKL